MRAVFRVDASIHMGTGHVMRCLTLADVLKGLRVSTVFIIREHIGHLSGLIQERGHDVALLPEPDPNFKPAKNDVAHAQWLGVPWQQDAKETIMAMNGVKPDLLIVDHYGLDARWHKELRQYVGKVFAIDDLADRPIDCDILLDQNLVANMNNRYAEKLPLHCKTLLGPKYAMLQPTYAEWHKCVSPRTGPVQRIFIYFSGADVDNLTGRSVSAFLSLNRPDIEVDVVISHTSPYADAILSQAKGHSNLHVHGFVPSLAPLMAKADLAIGASGATSWERLCLGLPSLVVTLEENQRPIAEELQRRDLIYFLGHKDTVDEAAISQALTEIMQQDIVADWPQRCMEIVDGKGVDRVCAALAGLHKVS